jgi:hypothetical protein
MDLWSLLVVSIGFLVTSSQGLHHDGKRTFTGKMSPTLEKIRRMVSDKFNSLKNFVH